MKKTLPYMLLLCIVCSIPLALTAGGKPDPNMRRELHSYIQQNVMPVLKEHRQLLDRQMSAADKRQVEKLRQELKKLESQRAQFRKDGPRHHTALTNEQKAQLKAQRETRHRIYTAAGNIASKYKPQLERIHTSIASHKPTWETDIKALADKAEAQTEEQRFHRRPQHFGRLMPFHHLMRPVQFLLWDVSAITAPTVIEPENSTSVFPNPSSTSNTIAYAVDQAGPVKISLLNDQGTSLRVLLNERKAVGAYTLDVQVQHLANGIYFYKIETAAGAETLRFLKR